MWSHQVAFKEIFLHRLSHKLAQTLGSNSQELRWNYTPSKLSSTRSIYCKSPNDYACRIEKTMTQSHRFFKVHLEDQTLFLHFPCLIHHFVSRKSTIKHVSSPNKDPFTSIDDVLQHTSDYARQQFTLDLIDKSNKRYRPEFIKAMRIYILRYQWKERCIPGKDSILKVTFLKVVINDNIDNININS